MMTVISSEWLLQHFSSHCTFTPFLRTSDPEGKADKKFFSTSDNSWQAKRKPLRNTIICHLRLAEMLKKKKISVWCRLGADEALTRKEKRDFAFKRWPDIKGTRDFPIMTMWLTRSGLRNQYLIKKNSWKIQFSRTRLNQSGCLWSAPKKKPSPIFGTGL